MALLEVRNLVKHFGPARDPVRAVDGVDLVIEPGVCFGLLGPNGAGKTTTLEIVEGIMPPDAGEVRFKDTPRAADFRQRVGIMFQATELLAFLTVRETLETFASLYASRADMDGLIRMTQLAELLPRRNDRLSGGQKQRLLLALALINDPDLVFLDEPTTGLDPQARRHVWDIIQRIKDRGKTLVLTTHYMEEAESLCDELVIMDQGRVIAQGSPRQLVEANCPGAVVSLPREYAPDPLPEEVLDTCAVLEEGDGGRLVLQSERPEACVDRLIESGLKLADLTVRRRNLEDVFLALTGRSLRE
jgi:ABC-2 type transport system ATP-binding protein